MVNREDAKSAKRKQFERRRGKQTRSLAYWPTHSPVRDAELVNPERIIAP
jgi:hypothetical protein